MDAREPGWAAICIRGPRSRERDALSPWRVPADRDARFARAPFRRSLTRHVTYYACGNGASARLPEIPTIRWALPLPPPESLLRGGHDERTISEGGYSGSRTRGS